MKFKNVQTVHPLSDENGLIQIDLDHEKDHKYRNETFFLNKDNEIVAHFEHENWLSVELLSEKNHSIYEIRYDDKNKKECHQIVKVNPDLSYTVLHDIEYIEYGIEDNTFAIMKNGLYGFIDYNGKEIIKPQYEKYCAFHNGIACVYKNKNCGKWGFINKQNETVIPFMYDTPEYEFTMFEIYLGTRTSTGEETRFDNYSGTLCAPVAQNGKYGFVNNKNETIIPFMYDNAIVYYGKKPSKVFCVKSGNKWGFVDINNNIVTPFEYDAVESDGNELSFFIVLKGKAEDEKHLHGLINRFGELVVPCEYLNIEVSENSINAKKQNGKHVLLNYKGNIISEEFDYIKRYSYDDIYLAGNGKKFCYINTKGEKITSLQYKKCSHYFCGGLAQAIREDFLADIINTKGEILYHAKNNKEVFNLGNGCILAENKANEFEVVKL